MAIFDQSESEKEGRRRYFTAEVETLIILLVFPAIGHWLNPVDPLFVHSEFPWLIFATLLPALRYGFAYGFASAMLLIALLGAATHWQVLGIHNFPVKYSIGLLLSAMLAGEFVDLWIKREAQQRIVNSYQHMRLEEFTRSYHLLKVSHDRMEHRLAAGTVSLREALVGLRRRLMLSGVEEALTQETGGQILRLFADYVSIRVAAIYRTDETHKVLPDPIATLGQCRLGSNHEMVLQSVQRACLISVRDILDRKEAAAAGPLAVVPLIDVNDRIHGVLVIEDMLFLSMQEENLRLLAVLGGHIGDMVALAADRGGPDADGAQFFRETQRAILNRRQYGLPAMLVSTALPHGETGKEVEALLLRQRRGLDCVWVRGGDGGKTMLLLMPLTGTVEYEGYRKRIDHIIREHFGKTCEELDMWIVPREIKAKDTIDKLLTPYDDEKPKDIAAAAGI
ncbi:MAG: PelD GGDEF domain-containing protein [Desulfobacterales bacterium]|jgi:hypothetical protein